MDLHSYLVNVEKNLKKDGGKARLMNLLIQVLGGRLISVVIRLLSELVKYFGLKCIHGTYGTVFVKDNWFC